MKFKKENETAIIILILFITVFVIFNITSIIITSIMEKTNETNELYYIIIISIICPILLLIIQSNNRNKKYEKLYNKFKNEQKITGFIISTFEYKYRYGRNNYKISYGLKVLAQNKIYIVDRLENNESYKKLEKILNEVQINYDIVSFKKIPVDVYLKNDDYFVDIESVKI